MKSYIVYYQKIIFQKFNARYLTIPACDETCLVSTIALNLEDPLVLLTPMIKGHKTFACLVPYLLLVHIGEFLFDCFLSFNARTCIEMVPGFGEGLGLFRYRFAVSGHHSQIDEKI